MVVESFLTCFGGGRDRECQVCRTQERGATSGKGSFGRGTSDEVVLLECKNDEQKNDHYNTLKLFQKPSSSRVYHEFLGYFSDRRENKLCDRHILSCSCLVQLGASIVTAV